MRISVVGVGNLLIGDDGVGIHAVQMLESMDLPDHVEVFDADSNTFLLLEAIDGRDRAIVIDAYENGKEPGTVQKFKIDTKNLPDSDIKLSLHDMDFFEGLKMGETADIKLPKEIVVIGVEPGSLEAGMELSPDVKAVLPEIIDKIKEEF
jgi:hydrogenase maturation protease